MNWETENSQHHKARTRALAFYLPQFHPIAENDAWWGRGFTEWTTVAAAGPVFEGHQQPHLPADLGFYDLRLAEVRQAQADLARAHGIDGFVYYHYWSQGQRLLERPFEEMLTIGQPDFPFALCWANEDWRARWDGRSGELLWEQRYSERDDAAHIDYLVRCFADGRYIRVDGKPLFLVYRAASLPAPAAFVGDLRRAAAEAGVGELMVCRVESGFSGEAGDPAALGFDAAVEFQPDWERLPIPDAAHAPHTVVDYSEAVAAMLAKPPATYRRLPCVTPRWDNTPRRRDGATVLRDSTPELYRRWLSQVAEAAWQGTDDPVVFVNAWNEWGEGAHLEPDQRYGHAYLLAHAGGIAGTSPLADLARPAMAEHHLIFSELVAGAERAAVSGDDEQALELGWAAAEWAWHHHTGRFASERLEALVQGVAERHVAPQLRTDHGGRRRLLHVLTETEGLAGHGDTLCDWIRVDEASLHSVILTGQCTAVPDRLLDVVRRSGGAVQVLGQASLLERVDAVAEAACDAEVVVLHSHPSDVVAATALAHPRRTVPAILVNHADQVFWVGLAAADLIAESRPSGSRLTRRRRGVGGDRQVELPQALAPSSAAAAVRRDLGVPAGATVLATAASPYQGVPGHGVPLIDLVAETLAAPADTVLLVGGHTAADSPWAGVRERFGDRVRLLACREESAQAMAAADLCVGAYPCEDIRPLLLAGAAGVPIVLLAPAQYRGTPLGFDDFVVDEALLTRAPTPDAWRSAVAALLNDAGERGRQGAALAEAVACGHGDGTVRERVEHMYQRARSLQTSADRLPRHVDAVPTAWQDLLTMVYLHSGMARALEDIVPPAPDVAASPSGARHADCSVLIWSRRGADALLGCLSGVLEGCGEHAALDVIVLHEGQPEVAGVLHALRDDLRGVLVSSQPSDGAPWAAGLAVARGRRVLLLTDDVVCPPGLLAHCEQAHLREGPRSGVLVDQHNRHDRLPAAQELSADAGVCMFADRRAVLAGTVEVVAYPLTTAARQPSANQVLCIAGMHRSHTSVCARWLQECGLQIHNGALVPGGDGNEGGHFEDLEFHALHSGALRRWHPGSDGWRAEGFQGLRMEGDERRAAHQLVDARNVRYRVWGWKDPRTVLFLEDWRSILPDMKVLALWRREDEVVRSLVRRSSSANLELGIDEGAARSLWRGHNEIIRRYRAEHPDSTVLVESADLFTADRPVFDAVNALLGGSLTYVPFRAVADGPRRGADGGKATGGAEPGMSQLEQALRGLSHTG